MREDRRFRVYGVVFDSDFPFHSRILPAEGDPAFRFTGGLVLDPGWRREFRHLYSSAMRDADGEPIFKLYAQGDRELLRFSGLTDFLFSPGTILWGSLDPGEAEDTERLFLSAVLAYWLELSGVLAIHAAAVEVGSGVAAFLAPAGSGKSSLAADFVFSGHSLVTDDVLPIVRQNGTFHAHAGYPILRLNPDSGHRYLGEEFERLDRFHPLGEKRCWPMTAADVRFQSTGGVVRCLYILHRRGSEEERGAPVIETVARRDAVIEVLRATFTPVLVEGVGLAAERLGRLADLVQQVPVRRLTYDTDLERLPEVVEAVTRDLA